VFSLVIVPAVPEENATNQANPGISEGQHLCSERRGVEKVVQGITDVGPENRHKNKLGKEKIHPENSKIRYSIDGNAKQETFDFIFHE
jgi:hypothetical protein